MNKDKLRAYAVSFLLLWCWALTLLIADYGQQIQQLQSQQTEILTKISAVQQTQIIERELAGLQEVK